MLPFYYVRTLEKIEIALMDMFNDLRVNKYNDISRTTYTKTVPVPLMTHVDKNFANFWRSRLKAKMPLPIPCAGLRFKGIAPNNPNRTQTTYARSIFSKASQQWIQDIQPTPYYVTYDLEFLTDNRGDWGQLVENVLPYFNTYRTLRIKEFDFFSDIEAKIPVFLEGITTTFEDELEAGSKHRFIKLNVSLRCDVDLYRPFEIPEIIKYAEMNINVGQFIHRHQVFVYPDPIAKKEKKDWETLAPSVREGMTLLNSVAGSLVKEVNLDGSTYLKEITLPDAIRPVKVPSYKELSFTFDINTPNEIDLSGFGRDFVALNDSNRTYVPTLPPGAGSTAPDGYAPNASAWNDILTWFGTEEGLNGSPYTFDIILQFVNLNPEDTIFQTLHNKETPNYKDNKTLPAGEVFFEWGLISSQLYFTMRTVKLAADGTFTEVLSQTFTSIDKLELNNTAIYKFTFVLHDKGREGMFGYSVDGGSTIVLNTVKE